MVQSPSTKTVQSGATFELLESRRLLSVSQIDFSNFASTTGLVTTGYGKSAVTDKKQLVLTDGNGGEGRSVYWATQVGTQTFTTSFQFQIGAGAQTADGFTFLLQNKGPTALGSAGNGLGYAGIERSVAVSFNLFNYDDDLFESD